jgi:2-iminobutanoate/2-iminopropanoate deaminase
MHSPRLAAAPRPSPETPLWNVYPPGSTLASAVKCQVFLKDLSDFVAVNEVYAEFFPGETPPARACVEVARLPKDVMVEIDCVAFLG